MHYDSERTENKVYYKLPLEDKERHHSFLSPSQHDLPSSHAPHVTQAPRDLQCLQADRRTNK
ncbi:hypothetical protein E2C01_007744 [Portunus trituberculatus]|uniref:Uncharacterized protein n=1 Tax=Portunus trituberculatus TaxID=210409 RepID=A0A5B7D205_PORTR|nr:hypothetical protein [Portunus trituberculatus]